MGAPTITVTLTGATAERLSRIVESGGYDSPEAAIADALDDIPVSGDPEIEAWLRDVVVKRCEESARDPSRSIPIDEALRRLEKR